MLIWSLALPSLQIILFTYFIYLARIFKKIRTLLRYAVQQSLRALYKIQLIQFQNVAGALQRLNSATNILQSLNRVINAVSHLWPSIIRIRLNVVIILSLCNVSRPYVATQAKRHRVLVNLSQARRDPIYVLLQFSKALSAIGCVKYFINQQQQVPILNSNYIQALVVIADLYTTTRFRGKEKQYSSQ